MGLSRTESKANLGQSLAAVLFYVALQGSMRFGTSLLGELLEPDHFGTFCSRASVGKPSDCHIGPNQLGGQAAILH